MALSLAVNLPCRTSFLHTSQDEYGVDTTLEPLSYNVARWVAGGWGVLEGCGRLFNTTVMKDVYGRPVLLFRNEFALQQVGAGAGAWGYLWRAEGDRRGGGVRNAVAVSSPLPFSGSKVGPNCGGLER